MTIQVEQATGPVAYHGEDPAWSTLRCGLRYARMRLRLRPRARDFAT